MNWEHHWSSQTLSLAEHRAYPIHGALDLAKASAGWSKTALLSFGVAGVLLGAVIGDVGLVMFLRGMGGQP